MHLFKGLLHKKAGAAEAKQPGEQLKGPCSAQKARPPLVVV